MEEERDKGEQEALGREGGASGRRIMLRGEEMGRIEEEAGFSTEEIVWREIGSILFPKKKQKNSDLASASSTTLSDFDGDEYNKVILAQLDDVEYLGGEVKKHLTGVEDLYFDVVAGDKRRISKKESKKDGEFQKRLLPILDTYAQVIVENGVSVRTLI